MIRTVFAMMVATLLMLAVSGTSQAVPIARGHGDASVLVSSSLLSSSSPLLAWPLGPRALRLVVVALPTGF